MLLVALAWGIGIERIVEHATGIDGRIAALVVTIAALQVLLVTWRWRLVCGALDCRVPYRRLFEIQSLSGLAGSVLPTGIGGAALRLAMIYREGVSLATAASSILIDRIVATVVLVLMVVLTQPFLIAQVGPLVERGPPLWLLAVLLLAGLAASFVLLPWLAIRLGQALSVIGTMLEQFRGFAGKAAPLGATLAVAALAQVVLFLVAFLIGSGLGIELTLLHYLLLMPSISLLASLPISFGGWGVREGSLVAGLSLFQVPPEKALLLGVSIGIVTLVGLLPGALLWSLERRDRPRCAKEGLIPAVGATTPNR